MNTDRTARHNALVLASAQALNSSSGVIAVSLGGLSGAYLLADDKSLATLPVAFYQVGTALFAMPAALASKHFGRKRAFIGGAIMAIGAALLAMTALLLPNFIGFCLAFIGLGMANAFVQQYRFAAADTGSKTFKPKAISWVLTGGFLAAILGPQTLLLTKDKLLPTPYAGGFIGLIALLLMGTIALSFLWPTTKSKSDTPSLDTPARPLWEIARQPRFIVALICAISSYALMSFMMTGAPLAMVNHGHSQAHAVLGIQWHVMAMYAPSIVTGGLIVRFGKIKIIATGLLILILCAIVALSGYGLWNFWTSLILLGLGWNFAFIGATALLADTYFDCERNKAQGLHDMILFSTVASSALLSGVTLNHFGWVGLSTVLIPVSVLSLISLVLLTLWENSQKKCVEGL